MNEQDLQKSERVASKLMRALAITGLVAVLALAAWVVVQGVRYVPQAGEGMSAAVSMLTSIFRSAPDESLVFEMSARTLTSGEPATVRWAWTGPSEPNTYEFSYSCASGVSIEVRGAMSKTLACNTPLTVSGRELVIVPRSSSTRFADVDLSIEGGDLEDSTLLTIVNTAIALGGAPTTTPTGTPSEPVEAVKPALTKPVTTPVVTPKPVATAPATTPKPVTTVTPVKPAVTGPADLVINIEETGVLVKVAGESTFFPVSPIPNDKTAGVRFTVTNRGGEASGAWVFVATLPIEGDSTYKYTSKAQESLAPGMQVEYTLGFDEVIDAKSGAIKVELKPTKTSDKKENNIDAVLVNIRQTD